MDSLISMLNRYVESEISIRLSGYIGRTGHDTLKFMKSKSDEIIFGSEDSAENEYDEIRALASIINYKNKYYVFNRDRYTHDK